MDTATLAAALALLLALVVGGCLGALVAVLRGRRFGRDRAYDGTRPSDRERGR